MPDVRVCLKMDEELYLGIKNGLLELCGLVKNADNKRVVKHIPMVVDTAKKGAVKAADFIREHPKTFIIDGVIIAGGVITGGVIGWKLCQNQCKIDKQFSTAVQEYLDAAKNGTMSIDILNTLICSIETIEQNNPNHSVTLNITQFSELIHCVFDYTKQLAEAYNASNLFINCPDSIKEKPVNNLKYYLQIQKQIFEQAA